MRLGVIADDFTGATDIASFLVQNGMSTVQVNGVPAEALELNADAIVVSLKSRSCAPEKAVADSLRRCSGYSSRAASASILNTAPPSTAPPRAILAR